MYDDFLSMLILIVGILIVIIIIDWFWLKPRQEYNRIDKIISKLSQPKNYIKFPKFKGRGILMLINDHSMLRGTLTILTLRRIGCTLPIIIAYTRDELDVKYRKILSNIPSLSLMDLSSLPLPINALRGYKSKIYAMIYSPLEEVLVIEPDLLFLRDPEYLFNIPEYVQTGAVFWKDRYIKNYWDKKVSDWTRRLIPYRKGDNRILKENHPIIRAQIY